jgi:hypothetical protein
MTTMKATKTLGVALAVLLLPHIAVAETWLTLEASEYPPEVKKALDDVRSACKGEEHEVVDDPQAGVTIIDLDRDGSKDILLEAWRTCSVEMKGAGCNAAGCVLQIFKQVGPHKWKSVFDETIDPVWFLSASQEGYFRLMALSVSRKITDRCPDPSGSACDYLLYWKHGHWVWDRIR